MSAPPFRVKIETLTTGVAATTVSLGGAAHPVFMTPAEAGMRHLRSYDYIIQQGDDWEHQNGEYNETAMTLTRSNLVKSKINGVLGTSRINLNGRALIYFPQLEITQFDKGPRGDCQLICLNTTQCRLYPLRGNSLVINYRREIVPSDGVLASNAGLAANTTYFAYAYMNGDAMAIEFSTTLPAISNGQGIMTKSGAGGDTHTLIGMLRTGTGGVFRIGGENPAHALFRSWYNDRGVHAVAIPTVTNPSIPNNSVWTEVHSSLRIEFCAWAGEVVQIMMGGMFAPYGGGFGNFCFRDETGTPVPGTFTGWNGVHSTDGLNTPFQNWLRLNMLTSRKYPGPPGYHYITPFAFWASTNLGTITFPGNTWGVRMPGIFIPSRLER